MDPRNPPPVILDIDEKRKRLTLRFDDGRVAEIPVSKFKDISLGYAVTTHKAQGVTVDSAFVLLGGPMQDKELSYVQASRARQETRLYADRDTAGDDLADVSRVMQRPRTKELAVTKQAELRRFREREA
jgi:ATP-dependent exoDNAse (exonuclease V) alpha subunit